ncbi:M23 family metallopeptidase [Streptomyces sp. NPDC002677]|uniref:murein hydrolase activator EnvC family protein n=1 Tax=Streptomyces sp. NPDC002677 TaxID=3154774 RepID=UPI00332E5A9A
MIGGLRDGSVMWAMRRTMRWMWAATVPLLLAVAGTWAWTWNRAVAWAADPPPPPATVPAIGRAWPVGVRPPVLRGWEPPATVYGPGHRGVDLGAAPGAEVRAVAAGRVSFAGRVAGRGVVSVRLAGTDLRTTYEPVTVQVKKGEEVTAGQVVGTVERLGAHCGARACVHWGLLRGDVYVDPLLLLPPWLLNGGPSRLLPVLGVPLPEG